MDHAFVWNRFKSQFLQVNKDFLYFCLLMWMEGRRCPTPTLSYQYKSPFFPWKLNVYFSCCRSLTFTSIFGYFAFAADVIPPVSSNRKKREEDRKYTCFVFISGFPVRLHLSLFIYIDYYWFDYSQTTFDYAKPCFVAVNATFCEQL